MLWKSGETVFSTKTAACIQFWLHAYCTYYTGVSWRFSYSGAQEMYRAGVRIAHRVLKLSSRSVDCNAEVVCASFSQSARRALASGECADVCEFAGVGGQRTLLHAV